MKFPDTQREARDSQILSASLLKAMDVAVIATTVQGEVIYWSRYAEHLYGWPAHEVIGRNILDITVAPENVDQAGQIMAELSRGRSWTGEFRLLRKDGSIFTGLVTDSPVFDENGNHVGIVGVSHPLSETRLGFEKQAQEHAASLRLLSQRLLHAQDKERRKIARNLHDSVGQSVSLIKMALIAIADPTGRVKPEVVEEIRMFANTAITEIRTMSYLLHPPFLEEMGLATAAQWLVEGFAQRSGIKVVCDVPDQMPRLSANLETALYRILQECLTNAHRHSGSSSAKVRISCISETLMLEVTDYGCGIPTNKIAESGVGLAGIRERVGELNGKLEILSSNTGTTIRVSFKATMEPRGKSASA